jgi:hypothetical protein
MGEDGLDLVVGQAMQQGVVEHDPLVPAETREIRVAVRGAA